MIFFGEGSLHRAICEYVEHYHRERPHQGLDNRIIDRAVRIEPFSTTEIHVHKRLGGLLRYYRTAA